MIFLMHSKLEFTAGADACIGPYKMFTNSGHLSMVKITKKECQFL